MTTLKVRDLDYLGHLVRESARFVAVLDATAPVAAVPSCPEWTADDLLWHLAEVQWFWGTIVRERLTTTQQAEKLQAQRPPGRSALREFYATASRDLAAALAAADPRTPVWTWADDQTAGFVRRRQAHEALIHRVDAELTPGDRTPLDAELSADGVDEALRIMYGGELPAWGTLVPDGDKTLRVHATDTGDSWLITIGQFRGTDPDDGKVYDRQGIQAAPDDPGRAAAATVTGSAADLDCWLWHRPPLGEVRQAGDPGTLASFESVIAEGIG